METIKITVLELFLIRNLLMGIECHGFVNELALTEGTKRKANKALKIIIDELKPIGIQLDKIREEKDVAKESDLLADVISFSLEKIDFKFVENVSLSNNYQLLYDNIFINS